MVKIGTIKSSFSTIRVILLKFWVRKEVLLGVYLNRLKISPGNFPVYAPSKFLLPQSPGIVSKDKQFCKN